MQTLTCEVTEVEQLSCEATDHMYALFKANYEGVSHAQFVGDLQEKDGVFLLRDDIGGIQGFSTYLVGADRCGDRPIRTIFSGDTIISPEYWGRNDFAFKWIQHAGRILAEYPAIPLYWFLIVKGHRTYRYLSAFSREYFPAPDRETPADAQALMHRLARRRFGSNYDAALGVVRYPASQGHLMPSLARIPEKDAARREVRFFLERNPGYARGEELVCLCRLEPDNLKPLARRAFEAGMREGMAGATTTLRMAG